MSARIVLQPADISRALTRISHEILEANRGSDNLLILGIPTRGVALAQRIGETIARIEANGVNTTDTTNATNAAGVPNAATDTAPDVAGQHGLITSAVLVGSLDVTMYRDDLGRNPTRTPAPTQLPASVDGKTVVLVDDVLYSGRTIRAALDALSDLGRPKAVRLAVLVDRGHREQPIRADFVGKNLPSSAQERINVRLTEVDGEDFVSIEGGA